MYLHNGLKLVSYPKDYLMWNATFEIWDTKCYDRYIPLTEGMTVVDAGASIGFFTVYASQKVGASGRVIAFEPEPVSYSHLARNVADLPNVTAENMGLSNGDKLAKMFYRNNGYSLYKTGDRAVDLTLRRLDSVLPNLGVSHVDFLKIDTEGAEFQILEGLGEMLWSVDNIAMELHSTWEKNVENPQQLRQLLERYGFRVKQTTHYGYFPYMYATRDSTVQFPLVETWQVLALAGLAGLIAYQVTRK